MSSLLKLLLVTSFFNALSWIILIPLWQYPDEQAHFAQIQYIAEIGGVPRNNQVFDTSLEVALSEKLLGTERDEFGNNKFTYHPEYKLDYANELWGPGEAEITNQPKSSRVKLVKNEATLNPPLYYFLGSLVYRIFYFGNLFTRVHTIRLISVAFFLATVLVSFKTGQSIFKNDKILPLVLASIVAFLPMFVFSSTGVLPDPLTNLFFSLFIFICLKIIIENFSLVKLLGLATIIILGSITRQNFLITLFIVPFVICQQFLFNKKLRKVILISFFALGISLYVSGFFIESLSYIRRFDFPESSRKIVNNPLYNINYLDHLSWTLRHSVEEVWPWFWGIYKWLSLSLPPVVYQIINRLMIISIVGVILKIFEIVRQKDLKKEFWFLFLILVAFIYFMGMATFDFFYRKNNGFSFGIQGRYFFPVIVVATVLILTGFRQVFEMVFRKFSKYALFGLILAIIVFNDFSLAFVASSYYETSTLANFINHVSHYKPLIFKGNIIIIILFATLLLQQAFLFAFLKYIISTKSRFNESI